MHIKPRSQQQNLGGLAVVCHFTYEAQYEKTIVVFCCLDTVPACLGPTGEPAIEATVRRHSVL